MELTVEDILLIHWSGVEEELREEEGYYGLYIANSIEDYRDVSKVVLPLLYPSMFTVTYEECIV